MAEDLIFVRFSFSHCSHASVNVATTQERLSFPDISHPFAASPPHIENGGESAEILQMQVIRRIVHVIVMPANLENSGLPRRRFASAPASARRAILMYCIDTLLALAF